MKKLIFVLSVVLLAAGSNRPAFCQGTLVFNNLGPGDGQVLLSIGASIAMPLNQDLNFGLRVEEPGTELPIFQRTWLLSDGTATGINVALGRFADPSHSVIVLPGVAPGAAINVSVDAWTGNYATWSQALRAGEATGTVGFTMGAGSMDAPPASLYGMRGELAVGAVPEPRIISLALIGMVLLFVYRVTYPRSEKNH